MDKDPEWVDARQAFNNCLQYATAYNATMLKRVEIAKPEFFEEASMTQSEMISHLSNNMCLAETKYKNRMFRKRLSNLKEEEVLKDSIRRLYNDGDKFHPYI